MNTRFFVSVTALVCFISTLSSTAASQTTETPPQDIFLALTIRSTLSPYESVRTEIRTRGETLLVSQAKELVGSYGDLQDVSLLPIGALPSLLLALSECDLESAGEPSIDPDAEMTYTLQIQLGEVTREHLWTYRENRPGTPFWCASRLFIDTYVASGDPVPFQDLFWEPGQYGELSTTSVPPARLFVDGRDTGLTTPVYNLRLEPGVHILRYVNTPLGIDRVYDATIVAEHTTRINVELR